MSTEQPWYVGPWELAQDLSKIDSQWPAVREILDDPALFDLSDESVSGWSCGEQAGHMVITARTIAGRIEGNLAKPRRNVDGEQIELAAKVLEAGRFTRGVAKAPPELQPTGRTRDEFLALLPETIDAWSSLRARADEITECPAKFPHFVFGYFTSTEWVRMCVVHTAHHLKVVRDIRATVEGAAESA